MVLLLLGELRGGVEVHKHMYYDSMRHGGWENGLDGAGRLVASHSGRADDRGRRDIRAAEFYRPGAGNAGLSWTFPDQWRESAQPDGAMPSRRG